MFVNGTCDVVKVKAAAPVLFSLAVKMTDGLVIEKRVVSFCEALVS